MDKCSIQWTILIKRWLARVDALILFIFLLFHTFTFLKRPVLIIGIFVAPVTNEQNECI